MAVLGFGVTHVHIAARNDHGHILSFKEFFVLEHNGQSDCTTRFTNDLESVPNKEEGFSYFFITDGENRFTIVLNDGERNGGEASPQSIANSKRNQLRLKFLLFKTLLGISGKVRFTANNLGGLGEVVGGDYRASQVASGAYGDKEVVEGDRTLLIDFVGPGALSSDGVQVVAPRDVVVLGLLDDLIQSFLPALVRCTAEVDLSSQGLDVLPLDNRTVGGHDYLALGGELVGNVGEGGGHVARGHSGHSLHAPSLLLILLPLLQESVGRPPHLE